jgi:nucleoside-triphosphatase THEP1
MSVDKMRIAAVVYPVSEGAHADTVLSEVARDLKSRGLRIAGAVQHNTHSGDRCRCDMTLEDLASGTLVQISEDRGPEARGCRLDSSALEEIVGLVCSSLEGKPDLVVVNKFGKREAEGSGFRAAIEQALDSGIAVLTAVSSTNLAEWENFAGGLDERLPLEPTAIAAWCSKADRHSDLEAAASP